MKQKVLTILGSVLINFIVYFSLLAQQITTYTTYDGLVNNTVFSTFEDNNNDIWFGTMGGLGKWMHDIDDWIKYTPENSPLVNNKVNAILQDNDGHLWFGTNDGLNEFDGANWKQYTHQMMPNILRAEHITSLYLDIKNNLWIGTKGDGVTKRYRDTDGVWKWQPYDMSNSDIIGDKITTINEDKLGNIWFGTLDEGVCKFDGKSNWTSYAGITEIGSKITVIFKDRYDTLWIGSDKGLVRTFDGTEWIPCKLDPTLMPVVRSIAEDREGNLWFGTEKDGMYKYNRISCIKPQIPGLEFVPTIWSIISDYNGYLWLGTDGIGVIRLDLNWQKFNKDNSGLVDNYITSIDEDGDGNLWIGTKLNGIAKFNGIEFDTFNVDGNWFGTNRVNSIMVDRDIWIWCATKYGAHCFDGNPSTWFSYYEDSLAHNRVTTIFQDQQGLFWFGTWGGISRFDPFQFNDKRWTTIDTSDGLPDVLVKTIFEDQQGYLWFGTSTGGVCKFDGDSIVAVYDTSNGLIYNQVNAIIQDDDLNYWFGTGNGISKFDGNTGWEHFTKENSGLLDNYIKCLLKDGKDNIWVGTLAGGLSKYNGQIWVNFNILQVGSDEINDIFQDSYGNLWLGTTNGLVRYITDNIPPETIIIYSPNNIIDDTKALFMFKGIDTETPKDKLVYYYALKDYQAKYIQNWLFTKENYCEVHLPANGIYTFLVKAMDQDGNEDPTPASFQFIVDRSSPQTIIHYPKNEQIIVGEVPIIGTACDTSMVNVFRKYWLDYAEIDEKTFTRMSDWKIIKDTLSTPVINDTLIDWDANKWHGFYRLKLTSEDLMGLISEDSVDVEVVETLKEVPKDSGGLLECSQDKAQLYIPPWTLEKDMEIHLSPVNPSHIPSSQNEKVIYSSTAYHIGPCKIQLQKPATFNCHYFDSDIAGLDEKKLSLINLDVSKLCGGFIDPDRNTISTTISQFGTYILVEDNTPSKETPFISDVNCQPRIFSPMGTGFSKTTYIAFNLAGDSEVSIKIYNLAGRLVRVVLENELLRAGNKSIEWDGRDYNGNICPSDLYIVTIESEKEIEHKTVMILDKSRD